MTKNNKSNCNTKSKQANKGLVQKEKVGDENNC
jgi:hypothetical protein